MKMTMVRKAKHLAKHGYIPMASVWLNYIMESMRIEMWMAI